MIETTSHLHTCCMISTRNASYSDQFCMWQFIVLKKDMEALAKIV